MLHTTFHKAHQLPQPLSTSQMQDVHVIPVCCQLTELHATSYVPSNPEHPHPGNSLCVSQAWDTSSEITGAVPLVQGAAVNTQLTI